jgi:hypothetical protein
VPVVLDESGALPVIRLEGEVNIESAAELKGLLIKALGMGTETRVSLEKATDLDISAMQLLIATERDAAKSKIRFVLDGPVPDEISVAMVHAGFRKFPV